MGRPFTCKFSNQFLFLNVPNETRGAFTLKWAVFTCTQTHQLCTMYRHCRSIPLEKRTVDQGFRSLRGSSYHLFCEKQFPFQGRLLGRREKPAPFRPLVQIFVVRVIAIINYPSSFIMGMCNAVNFLLWSDSRMHTTVCHCAIIRMRAMPWFLGLVSSSFDLFPTKAAILGLVFHPIGESDGLREISVLNCCLFTFYFPWMSMVDFRFGFLERSVLTEIFNVMFHLFGRLIQ